MRESCRRTLPIAEIRDEHVCFHLDDVHARNIPDQVEKVDSLILKIEILQPASPTRPYNRGFMWMLKTLVCANETEITDFIIVAVQVLVSSPVRFKKSILRPQSGAKFGMVQCELQHLATLIDVRGHILLADHVDAIIHAIFHEHVVRVDGCRDDGEIWLVPGLNGILDGHVTDIGGKTLPEFIEIFQEFRVRVHNTYQFIIRMIFYGVEPGSAGMPAKSDDYNIFYHIQTKNII